AAWGDNSYAAAGGCGATAAGGGSPLPAAAGLRKRDLHKMPSGTFSGGDDGILCHFWRKTDQNMVVKATAFTNFLCFLPFSGRQGNAAMLYLL
ncbi:MAG: hypothetical protein IJJ88_07195, partial [Oscillospiraceae bacterium]|nr:hypothetical protein [Oscillospiraceae bacterium]